MAAETNSAIQKGISEIFSGKVGVLRGKKKRESPKFRNLQVQRRSGNTAMVLLLWQTHHLYDESLASYIFFLEKFHSVFLNHIYWVFGPFFKDTYFGIC